MIRLERTVRVQGQTNTSVTDWITSAPPAVLTPGRLLKHTRPRWGIENSCCYVRDVTLGEDRHRLRTGHAPHNFSTVRSFAIAFLKTTGHTEFAKTFREHLLHPTVLLRRVNLCY